MKVKPFHKKILSFEEIAEVCDSIRKKSESIVTSNGCFDILHQGHVKYLQDASEFGDRLIIGINSDSSVKRIKGKDRPVNNEESRASIISSLGFVDYCVIFSQDTPVELLKLIRPDVHVKGGDYEMNELIEKDTVEKHGGVVKIIPEVRGFSTTDLLKSITSQ